MSNFSKKSLNELIFRVPVIWHPKNEDIFLVGSVNVSQKVTIYNIGNEDLSPALELVVDDDTILFVVLLQFTPLMMLLRGRLLLEGHSFGAKN